jgi:hypothetical protein
VNAASGRPDDVPPFARPIRSGRTFSQEAPARIRGPSCWTDTAPQRQRREPGQQPSNPAVKSLVVGDSGVLGSSPQHALDPRLVLPEKLGAPTEAFGLVAFLSRLVGEVPCLPAGEPIASRRQVKLPDADAQGRALEPPTMAAIVRDGGLEPDPVVDVPARGRPVMEPKRGVIVVAEVGFVGDGRVGFIGSLVSPVPDATAIGAGDERHRADQISNGEDERVLDCSVRIPAPKLIKRPPGSGSAGNVRRATEKRQAAVDPAAGSATSDALSASAASAMSTQKLTACRSERT